MSTAMRREVHLPRGCLCLSRQAVWPSQDGSYLGMHLIAMGVEAKIGGGDIENPPKMDVFFFQFPIKMG